MCSSMAPAMYRSVKIELAALGTDAPAIGAARRADQSVMMVLSGAHVVLANRILSPVRSLSTANAL